MKICFTFPEWEPEFDRWATVTLIAQDDRSGLCKPSFLEKYLRKKKIHNVPPMEYIHMYLHIYNSHIYKDPNKKGWELIYLSLKKSLFENVQPQVTGTDNMHGTGETTSNW